MNSSDSQPQWPSTPDHRWRLERVGYSPARRGADVPPVLAEDEQGSDLALDKCGD